MASTFSPTLRLELIANGEQSGTWGATTNVNLGTLLEQAITGFLSKAQGDVANLTLTATNGAADEARNMVLDFTGALTAARNVVVPTAEKLYLVKNSTTGGYALTIKTAAGSGVAVAAGSAQWVYCDGTNVVQGLSGTLAAQSAASVAITGGTIAGLTTFTMTSGAATPATNDAAALGTSALMWSDLFLASGAVVNWNNGDVTMTHAANTLTFAGASSGYIFDTDIRLSAGAAAPTTNDAAALGTSTLMWSDLFLASGSVINFNNGDVTLTHSANTLTFAGASSGYAFDAQISMVDNTLSRPKLLDYSETVNALGSAGGTRTVDLTLGNVVTATVSTSANTFVFSNPSTTGTACSFTLILTNGGSQTVNWPAAVDWANGVAPVLTTSGVDILAFTTIDAGTRWYGFVGGKAFA